MGSDAQTFNTPLDTVNWPHRRNIATESSDITKILSKVVELLLGVGVFLGHLLVL